MVCRGSPNFHLCFSCITDSKVYSWNFQLASVSVPLLGVNFLQHFNLLVNIKGQQVVLADCPESVVHRPVPAFSSVSYLSAPQRLQKLPDVLSSGVFTTLTPCHGVCHHLLTNSGPLVYAKPWRVDPEKLSATKKEFSSMEKAGII